MLYVILLTLIFLLNSNAAKQLGALQSPSGEAVFFDTIQRIYVEKPFETLFLLQSEKNSCISLDKVWKTLQVPLLIASGSASEDTLKDRFRSKHLAVVCLSMNIDHQLLNVLAENLQYRRQTRIILHIADTKPTSTLLTFLGNYVEDKRMSNVIAIFHNFYTDYQYYRYNPFPSGHWTLEFLNKTAPYFLRHYVNMQGKTFITLPGQSAPRNVIYDDVTGKQHLSGYLSYLMIAFADKHNFTWQYLHPVTPDNTSYIIALFNNTRKGILDFAITLVPTYSKNFVSYPLENTKLFIVLPCPRPIAYSEVYVMVVSSQVIGILVILNLLFSMLETFAKHTFYKCSVAFNLSNVLVNGNIFRGVFGLSFDMSRYPPLPLKMLYGFLFILGLFVNNMYSAYFQTLFTSPPLQHKIVTFDDMRQQNFKIMFNRNEIEFYRRALGTKFNSLFKDIVQLEDSETFKRHRAEYDTTYAYTMPETIWPIFNFQQRTFHRKIYCLAPTLRFYDHLLMSVPLANNSYLLKPLNKMILRVHESGLIKHWRIMTLIGMWSRGQLSLKDNDTSQQFHDIRVEDMRLLWYLLLCGFGFSSFVFIVEIYVQKLRKRTRRG